MTRYLQPPPRYKLILASQSPRRKHLLAAAGISADHVIAADIDETVIKNERPARLCSAYGTEKALMLLLVSRRSVRFVCGYSCYMWATYFAQG